MLSELILQKALRIEKYLIAFCMLFGVQSSAYAQFTYLNHSNPPETKNVKEGIISVKYGSDIELSVPFATPGSSVKWEYRTKPGEARILIPSETGTSIMVNDIKEDIEYIATYSNGFINTEYRLLISCVTLVSNTDKACPNEAVVFDYTGGQFADKGKFEQRREGEGPTWRNISDFVGNSKTQWIINEAEKNFAVRVSLDYGYYNSTLGKTTSQEINIALRSDCKSECKQTSTGDFYVGTDFDPNKENASRIPEDVVSHFADYEIDFGSTNFSKYWLNNNASDFFGQDPSLDVSADVVGKNNYLFAQGRVDNPDGSFMDGEINDNITSLRFQVWDDKPDPNKNGVRGKSYRYKMRMYIQADKCHNTIENAWANAKFKAETMHGKQSSDCIEAYAYDNETGTELGHFIVENGAEWIMFKDVFDISAINTYTLIRFEVTFYGSFPYDANRGLDYFTFTPRFEQFGCAKLALDYISAEIENVCLSPQVLCAGQYTTAHAAGFPRDAVYRWYKKVGNNWVEDTKNYNIQNASIQAERGLVQYQLRVSSASYAEERVLDFTVSGNDCTISRPSKITGNTFCMPNVQSYFPNMIDHSTNVNYEWTMYKPDNSVWYDSKTKSDPHFEVLPSHEYSDVSSEFYNPNKNDSLVITLNDIDAATFEEGDYKLQLRALTSSSVDTTLDTIVHIYRTPNISLKLLGDKFTEGTDESNKTICPSDRRREIIAFAENSFDSPMLSKYVYSWNSVPGSPSVFIPDSEDPRKAKVNLAAIPEICSGDLENVEFTALATIGECSSSDKNKYDIDALDSLWINCDALIGKQDTFEVPMRREDADFTVPVPPFSSGCDSIPSITVEITPLRQEVKDTMGVKVITVLKTAVGHSDSLNVTLPWGAYDFHYIVKDGCDRIVDCNLPITVVKRYGPDVDCDLIVDLDKITGDYNSGASNKCMAVFDNMDITIPVLQDRNDDRGTMITGVYSGRQQFDSKQNKDALKASAADRAKFDKTVDLYDEYNANYTYILWTFTNDAGNSSWCVQEVLVRDTVKPHFDCGKIDPFVFRPVTKKGECEISFDQFWNELKNKNYIAYDSCPEPVREIVGELHADSINSSKIDGSRVFSVGIADTIYWQFRDPHDYGDNVKYCPQVINAFSGDSVKVDCDTINYREGLAEEGTCYANAADLNIPMPPYGKEPCTDENGDSILVPGIGTRSDGKALEDPYPTGDTYITWVFRGENSYPSTCETHVFVKGNKKPEIDCNRLFPKRYIDMPDCDPMDVELFPQRVADPCVAGYMMESVPYIVNGTDSTKLNLTHTFEIGETLVTWMFWDYTHNMPASCIQSIHLRDTFIPDVDCDTLKDSKVTLEGECSIPFADLRDSLGSKIALEHCTKDTIWGVPYLLDTITGARREFPSSVTVGHYPIQWVFANDSLTTKEAKCDKMLYLLHDIGTPFNCSQLESPKQLLDKEGLCKIELNPDLLPIPNAPDPCVVDFTVYAHGYVQLYGEGEYKELCYYDSVNNVEKYLMDLPLGGHNIKWRFENKYSTKVDSCIQVVKANSYALDSIHCEDLATYVHYTMRKQGEGATFEEVKDSGLIVPDPWDPCHVLDNVFTRNDGKSIYDIYPVHKITEITWLFKDTTKNANRQKECHTKVEVQDGDTPIMPCPVLEGQFACLEALPAQISTFKEFLASGGQLISNGVDVSDYVDPNSFRCDTMSIGDKCDFTFIRKYSIRNLRNQESSCQQEVRIKDDVPPVWMNGAASLRKIFDCEADNFFPTDLKAKDDCSNDIISEYHKVNHFDNIVDGIFYKVSSNRSSNPNECLYYNYSITYDYVAVDGCRNSSSELSFVAVVQDTFAPVISMPDTHKWRTDTVPATYAKKDCQFLYPDLTSNFPMDLVSDICDPASVKYFKIVQTPAAGTIIKNTKVPQYVTLHIVDPCGNEDTVMKQIFVQDTKDIIDVNLYDTTICAESNLTLSSLATTKGHIWEYDLFDEKWRPYENQNIEYDFYRGDVATGTLIYSNNKQTYAHKFDQKYSADYLLLNSIDQEGYYTIVGMDTALHCVDTTTAYVTINSRPSIWLDKTPLLVCERDSIHLESDNESLYEKYHLFIRDNGDSITEEGWMVNGEKYKPESLMEYTDQSLKLQYYAVNACGTGISYDYAPIYMRRRMSPENFMLTTTPSNPARVYSGESASLELVSKYKPELYMWFRVKGAVDGTYDDMFDKYGNVREQYINSRFEPDSLLYITYQDSLENKKFDLYSLGDTAQYYVLMVDSVCPAVPSNVVSIDVVKKLPTAFTPHNSLGKNDVFMEGHKVIIFNRYGQKMVESNDGWDGTCRGNLVDPGVYFYEVIINDGEKYKGSIEVVYFK